MTPASLAGVILQGVVWCWAELGWGPSNCHHYPHHHQPYLEDDVCSWRTLQGPFTVGKLWVFPLSVPVSRTLDLAAVELFKVTDTVVILVSSRAVDLVTAVTTVVLAVTEVGLVDTLAVAAVLALPGTGGYLAHEGQESLAPCQLPLLLVLAHHGLDTLPTGDVRLVEGPVSVVLTDLVPGGRGQAGGLQVVLSSEAEPVGVCLPQAAPQHLAGQLRGEVVLSEALYRHQVTAISRSKTAAIRPVLSTRPSPDSPFTNIRGLLPGMSDVKKLITINPLELPLT